jgi:alkylation response protein AidB-like acyl-CoA dehydrogenase
MVYDKESCQCLCAFSCAASIAQFGAIRSKLADMATSCYAGESATYRGVKILRPIIAREAEGMFNSSKAGLKGVEKSMSVLS